MEITMASTFSFITATTHAQSVGTWSSLDTFWQISNATSLLAVLEKLQHRTKEDVKKTYHSSHGELINMMRH